MVGSSSIPSRSTLKIGYFFLFLKIQTKKLTDNVDYRVLSTFLEFYETLMGFVLFRLYTSIGLNYPPRLNKKSEALGGGLDALLLQVEAQEFHGIKSINLSKKAEENVKD